MKRDVDLIRHLLLEIERLGAEASLDELRGGIGHEKDQRSRYHLRLLVDAGLAKEIDRTPSGLPSLRLTNAGHEFLDLCRSEARWREAKWMVQEQTGGLSLAVLRALLTKWAVEGLSRTARHRRWRRVYRPRYYRGEPVYRVESYRYEREPAFEEEPVRMLRPRGAHRRRQEPLDLWLDDGYADGDVADGSLGVSLPVHVI